jgi:hypothetical protein
MLLPRSRICHALNGNGVTQLAAKYGLEKARAQRDVDALMKGSSDLTPALPRQSRDCLGGYGLLLANGRF